MWCVCVCELIYVVILMLLCLCKGVASAMDQCEHREEGVPPSKSTPCGEHDSKTKALRWEDRL